MQILDSEGPIARYEDLGLPVNEGRLQIILVIEREDLSFLEGWDVAVGSQVDGRVQVFARPEDICGIAALGEVSAIRLPSLAQPQ